MIKSVHGFGAFLEGIQAPLAGFEFMRENTRLWRFGIWPVAVNLLLTGFLLVMLFGAGTYFVTNVHGRFSPNVFGRSLEILLIVFLLILACSMALAFWLVMQIAACGYFYGRLARQVELLLGTKKDEIVEAPLLAQIIDTLWETFSILLINLVCLLIQFFVPVVGTVLGIAGSYYFTCLALGREYWDYPLSLRGLRRNEKHQFAAQNRLRTLGLGTAVMILFLLPVVNAVLLTTAVTGAVLLHRKIIDETGCRACESPMPLLDAGASGNCVPTQEHGNEINQITA
jgi:uncharacterized protein involved in cysteine biosynthesis